MKTNGKYKIGIFDSGVGGLSVFRHAADRFSLADIEYLADTHRYPYGEKTEEEILRFTKEIFLFFKKRNCDALIIACSTASGVFQKNPSLSTFFPGTIVTMLNAHLWKEVDRLSKKDKVGIICTSLTKSVNQFAEYLKNFIPNLDVNCSAAPRLVELVTQGNTDNEAVYQAAQYYTRPLLAKEIDTLVIGCTHFHFVTSVLEKICGKDIALIAPAELSVKHLEDLLPLNENSFFKKRDIRFFVTGDVNDFYRQATQVAKISCSFEHFQKISLCHEKTSMSCDPAQF